VLVLAAVFSGLADLLLLEAFEDPDALCEARCAWPLVGAWWTREARAGAEESAAEASRTTNNRKECTMKSTSKQQNQREIAISVVPVCSLCKQEMRRAYRARTPNRKNAGVFDPGVPVLYSIAA